MILYAVICRVRDAVILVECSAQGLGGNASQAALSLLEFLRDNPDQVPDGERKTFSHQNEDVRDWFGDLYSACTSAEGAEGLENFFHVWRKDGVYYCCLSDEADRGEQRASFAFLDHIDVEFKKRFAARKIDKANAYGMEKSFSTEMRSAMHHYNVNQSSFSQEETVRQLTVQIDDLKQVMGRNINLMLKRGENMEKVLEKSEALRRDSMVFRKQSNQLKREMRRRNWCLTFLFVWGALAAMYLLGAFVCGITFSKCAFRESSS